MYKVLIVLSVLSTVTARNVLQQSADIEVLRGEQGHPVLIPCDLIVEDHVVIVWKHFRRILFAGPMRVRQDPRLRVEGKNLLVDNAQAKDAGEYTCQAELETGELLTNLKSLVVLQPATAKINPSGGVITVKAGTSMLLSCSGSGVPAPEVTWLREGKVIAAGKGEVDLPLKGITWQSGGLYQCQASNGVGEVDSKNFTIHVLHAPVVEVLPPEIEHMPSCKVQIQCLVYSAPASTVNWFHQGRLMKAGEDVTMWTLEYLHVLQLNDCTERTGDYTCVAENSLGSNEAITNLKQYMLEVVEEEVVVRVDRQISVHSGSSTVSTASATLFLLSLAYMRLL